MELVLEYSLMAARIFIVTMRAGAEVGLRIQPCQVGGFIRAAGTPPPAARWLGVTSSPLPLWGRGWPQLAERP